MPIKQTRTSRAKRKTILARQAALRYIRTPLLENPDVVHRVQQAQARPATQRRPAASSAKS